MVRVDMSPARAAITKRQRRRRVAAARRVARLRKQQRMELAAAETARQARRAAVAKWLAEDARLQRLPPRTPTPPKNANKRRAVTFADDVLVTAIPAAAQDSLPTPVSSPVGVAVSDSAIARQRLGERGLTPAARSVPTRGKYVTLADEWSDDSDDDDHDPEFVPDLVTDLDPAQHSRHRDVRRIQPVRISVGDPGQQARADAARSKQGEPKRKKKSAKRGRATTDVQPDQAAGNRDKASAPGNDEAAHQSPRPTAEDSLQKVSSPTSRKKKRKLSHDRAAPTSSSPAKESCLADRSATGDVTPRDGDRKKKRKLSHGGGSPTKSSAKKESSRPEAPEQAANGHASSPRHSRDDDEEEIDNLFGNLVKHRTAEKSKVARQATKEKQGVGPPKDIKNGKTKKNRDSPARYTEDGLRIVTYEEIAADQPKGLNGACPFDCSCCF